MSTVTFKRDDGREIDIETVWAPAEYDVGIMSAYIDEYTLPEGEPDLTDAEERRLLEDTPEPGPEYDDWGDYE